MLASIREEFVLRGERKWEEETAEIAYGGS